MGEDICFNIDNLVIKIRTITYNKYPKLEKLHRFADAFKDEKPKWQNNQSLLLLTNFLEFDPELEGDSTCPIITKNVQELSVNSDIGILTQLWMLDYFRLYQYQDIFILGVLLPTINQKTSTVYLYQCIKRLSSGSPYNSDKILNTWWVMLEKSYEQFTIFLMKNCQDPPLPNMIEKSKIKVFEKYGNFYSCLDYFYSRNWSLIANQKYKFITYLSELFSENTIAGFVMYLKNNHSRIVKRTFKSLIIINMNRIQIQYKNGVSFVQNNCKTIESDPFVACGNLWLFEVDFNSKLPITLITDSISPNDSNHVSSDQRSNFHEQSQKGLYKKVFLKVRLKFFKNLDMHSINYTKYLKLLNLRHTDENSYVTKEDIQRFNIDIGEEQSSDIIEDELSFNNNDLDNLVTKYNNQTVVFPQRNLFSVGWQPKELPKKPPISNKTTEYITKITYPMVIVFFCENLDINFLTSNNILLESLYPDCKAVKDLKKPFYFLVYHEDETQDFQEIEIPVDTQAFNLKIQIYVDHIMSAAMTDLVHYIAKNINNLKIPIYLKIQLEEFYICLKYLFEIRVESEYKIFMLFSNWIKFNAYYEIHELEILFNLFNWKAADKIKILEGLCSNDSIIRNKDQLGFLQKHHETLKNQKECIIGIDLKDRNTKSISGSGNMSSWLSRMPKLPFEFCERNMNDLNKVTFSHINSFDYLFYEDNCQRNQVHVFDEELVGDNGDLENSNYMETENDKDGYYANLKVIEEDFDSQFVDMCGFKEKILEVKAKNEMEKEYCLEKIKQLFADEC